ncbi:MAG: hypothetical protein IJV22_08820 [Bacteroidales bacterium]|nr:hypothetical protein [Bacteroidales bacterium]
MGVFPQHEQAVGRGAVGLRESDRTPLCDSMLAAGGGCAQESGLTSVVDVP